MKALEGMSEFFAARVEGYDLHMLSNVEGCREGYAQMADRIPKSITRLLDLGCGTGLELDAILSRMPDLSVTGIDLCPEMLERLRQKHPQESVELICGDYFKTDFGVGQYGCAVSFESLHHFTREKKAGLYQRIFQALEDGGVYLECDYMVRDEAEEARLFAECRRLRQEQGIDADAYCHYDTPCTVEGQIALLLGAGFSSVREVFCKGNTVLLLAQKKT